MKCDCGENMEGVSCYDTGGSTVSNVAYNVYQCNHCGTIKIEHVWNKPRVISIDVNFENGE